MNKKSDSYLEYLKNNELIIQSKEARPPPKPRFGFSSDLDCFTRAENVFDRPGVGWVRAAEEEGRRAEEARVAQEERTLAARDREKMWEEAERRQRDLRDLEDLELQRALEGAAPRPLPSPLNGSCFQGEFSCFQRDFTSFRGVFGPDIAPPSLARAPLDLPSPAL